MTAPLPAHLRFPGLALAAVAGLMLLCGLGGSGPAHAQQRNPQQTIGITVADRISPHYRFERFTVSSADGHRTWRITLGIPLADEAPPGGYPSFWMLDGNGALIEFDDALLEDLARQPRPQALVFVGYDNDLRIDSAARTRDYTFLSDSREASDPEARIGGGADAFLEVLERRVRPLLEQRVALDPQQRTLWGHSLGGLLVLHALYTRAGLFDTYAAASPSLWWRDGAMLGEPEQRFTGNNAGHRTRLLLTLGGGERARDTRNRDLSDPRVVEHLRRVSGAPSDAAYSLAGRLRQVPGLAVEYREFEGLGHGPMFRASLMDALHKVAGVADRSDTPRPPAIEGALPPRQASPESPAAQPQASTPRALPAPGPQAPRSSQ